MITGLRRVADLDTIIIDMERFKRLRLNIHTQVEKDYPGLKLSFDRRKRNRLTTLKQTLEVWFENHKTAMIKGTSVNLQIEAKKAGPESLMSTEQMVRELGAMCNIVDVRNYRLKNTITEMSLSQWTLKLIERNKNPHTMNFKLDYYPALVNHYKCINLTALEDEYIQYVFDLERLNSIIDESLAEVIEERERKEREQKEVKPFNRRRRVAGIPRAVADENAEIRLFIDNYLPTSSVPSTGFTISKPVIRTRNDILNDIKKMRKEIRKSLSDAQKAKTGKIVWSDRSNRSDRKEPETVFEDVAGEAEDIDNETATEKKERIERESKQNDMLISEDILNDDQDRDVISEDLQDTDIVGQEHNEHDENEDKDNEEEKERADALDEIELIQEDDDTGDSREMADYGEEDENDGNDDE